MSKEKVYMTMPLVENVPEPKDSSWKETTCSYCGNECWDRPIPEQLNEIYDVHKACTICALKRGGTSM